MMESGEGDGISGGGGGAAVNARYETEQAGRYSNSLEYVVQGMLEV